MQIAVNGGYPVVFAPQSIDAGIYARGPSVDYDFGPIITAGHTPDTAAGSLHTSVRSAWV